MKRWKLILIIVIVIGLLLGTALKYKSIKAHIIASFSNPQVVATATPQSYGYETDVFTDPQGTKLTYEFYIPRHYDATKKYPLVLILSGGGERSQPKNTTEQNLQLLLRQPYVEVWSGDFSRPYNPEVQQHWPCFVVVPQIAISQQWVDTNTRKGTYTQKAQPTDQLLAAKELVDALQHQYPNIDANRLYLFGLSLGGYGTWDAIERWPDYFAAAVPIAGAGDPSQAYKLTHMPIWAFHGSDDKTVPVSGSRDMINAIKQAGGNPRYTEFPGKDHGIWEYILDAGGSSDHFNGFYTWLFAQHK